MFFIEEHDTMMCHGAMEKLGEAQKSKVTRRSNGSDTLALLRDKNFMESEMRKKEI